jgi:hypothetical protein
MLLKVCLNGAREQAEPPVLPLTPAELAAAALAAVKAGATAIHLHPLSTSGCWGDVTSDAVGKQLSQFKRPDPHHSHAPKRLHLAYTGKRRSPFCILHSEEELP